MRDLTILHTSDWHLGHQLHGKKRDDEFEAFLAWLLKTIKSTGSATLVIAGDVFDTAMPSVSAQKQYYDFLIDAGRAGIRHIVITAGNHDSPSFLAAPREILKRLQIHVVGAASQNPEDEILVLEDENGQPELIVCAAPFLRERDVRGSTPGESIADKENSLGAGIRGHYAQLARAAEQKRQLLGKDIPVIATGHLFVSGSALSESERDLYIGNLGQVSPDIFPETFDYVALGHLHKPQQAGSQAHVRYCGSPIPLSFSETGYDKQILVARFSGRAPAIESLNVPLFRPLMSIKGSRTQILAQLEQMAREKGGEEIWLELRHDGTDMPGDLHTDAQETVQGTLIKILCTRPADRNCGAEEMRLERELRDITPEEMFSQLLDQRNVTDKEDMLLAFRKLLAAWHETRRESGV